MINLLKNAIEYFETIGDPKYKIYQLHLEELLQNPEILKKLSKELKKEKGDINAKPKKFVKLKTEDKIQINYRKNSAFINEDVDDQVKEILKNFKKDNKKNNKSWVDEDFKAQEDTFKMKLQAKKQKGQSVDIQLEKVITNEESNEMEFNNLQMDNISVNDIELTKVDKEKPIEKIQIIDSNNQMVEENFEKNENTLGLKKDNDRPTHRNKQASMFLSNEKPIQDFNKHQNSIIKGIKEKMIHFYQNLMNISIIISSINIQKKLRGCLIKNIRNT